MKTLKLWAAVAILCGIGAVSFKAGRDYEAYYYNYDNLFENYQATKDSCNKVYNVACRMSDLIRCYEDHLHEDSLIEDYNCFEDLEDIFLYDDAVGPIIDLDNYVYCY